MSPLPERNVTLVCFPFGVSTPDAYGWLDAGEATVGPRANAMRVQALSTWDSVARIAHNDFEAVVAPRFPEIAGALAALRAESDARDGREARIPSITLLAGSGATVFSVSDVPPDVSVAHGSSSRIVRTRTASRVVAVEASD
jgi:4-diphosphocytidyl-2C-methyl-D-erythritol kinase